MTDDIIVEKLLEENDEFKAAYEEHKAHRKVTEKLEKKHILTTEDEVELKRLKKIKLSLKDKMNAIITDSKENCA